MKILFSLLFLVNIVYSSIAVVSAFKGSADIYRDNQKIELFVGIEINKKDIIETYSNTKIQLIFKDNTRITIGKNSKFSVEDYLYDEKRPNASKAKFKFVKGLFRTISGRIGKLNKKQFKITVKNATIGIRGTKFDVYVANTYIKAGVYEGAIYFKNNGESVDIKAQHFFIYEYLKDKKIIKKGKFKESYEFSEKKQVEKIDKENKNIKKNDQKSKNTVSNDEDSSEDEEDKEINNELLNDQEPLTFVEPEAFEEPKSFDEPEISEEPTEEVIVTANTPNPTDISVSANLQKEITDGQNGVTDISDLDYGYWQDTNHNNIRVDTFVTGTLTPETVMAGYISDYQTVSYVGGISSIITAADGTKSSALGSINLLIDFGTQSFNGDININSGEYKAIINSGTLTSSDFMSTNFTNDYGTTGVNSGTINGNYYGVNGNSVGGTFILNGSDNSNVNGVFGANQQ